MSNDSKEEAGLLRSTASSFHAAHPHLHRVGVGNDVIVAYAHVAEHLDALPKSWEGAPVVGKLCAHVRPPMEATPVGFRVWDGKSVRPVARILFGDDGAGLTLIVHPAPYSATDALVHGESCQLLAAGPHGLHEGDVFACGQRRGSDKSEILYAVTREGGELGYKQLGKSCFTGEIDPSKVEVRGNVFENPELLA